MPDLGLTGLQHMSLSPLWTNINWDLEGRQDSFLNLEHSVHLSAYGIVQIPATVFKNGPGPTLLLMAGSHGDEYEGQAVLTRLIQTLDIKSLSGRIIVLPAANLPAVTNGTRVSPLDEGNLNRCFSDNFADSPTSLIAHYITNSILPMCDVFFDFHSGGTSLEYFPCTYASIPDNADKALFVLDAIEYMNAPVSWVQRGMPRGPEAGRAAYQQGVTYLSGEFGGGGRLSTQASTVATRSVYRLMTYLEMYPLADNWSDTLPTRMMQSDQDHYIYAEGGGVFEPAAALGDDVKSGDLMGTILNPEMPTRLEKQLLFPTSGKWICSRAIGRVRRGDCLGHLLVDVTREELLEAR